MQTMRYLIVGGGMTADAAVEGIREHDADGEIVIVGAEPHPPYKRPLLSKKLWAGGDEEKLWCDTELGGADLKTGRRIVELDLDAHAREGRPRRRVRVREGSARDGRRAAPSRRRRRRGHLLPDARPLPRAARSARKAARTSS